MTSRPKRCSCEQFRAQELCDSRGGRPGLPVLTVSVDVNNSEEEVFGLEFRICVKVGVDILGYPYLIVCTVSVDVNHH